MLDRLGMRAHRGTQIGQLSGGQQQRVFLARALAQEADVLLLDESMTGIDTATQEVIRASIDEQRRAGRIVLLATHDLASASCTCDSVQDTYTEATLAATYGGPVILLGGADRRSPAHDHHVGDAAHPTHGRDQAWGGPP